MRLERGGRHWLFLALAAVTAALPQTAAKAAVRRCGTLVSSDIVTAADELSAKKQALEQWNAKAKALGPGFDNWRIAIDRALKCVPAKSGAGFDCMAAASPCIIQQNPNQQPAGPGREGVGL